MPNHSQMGLFITVLAITLGAALISAARRRLQAWTPCDAEIVSVERKDSDWDTVQVKFSVAGRSVSAVVTARSELGYAQKLGAAVPIRYNPGAPEQARLASSGGKLHIIGAFLVLVGSLWIATMLAM